MSDNTDRPDSKTEKQSRPYEIASAFQEQFALRDEKESDYAKFKIPIPGLSFNGDKKKHDSITSGTGNVQDQTSELRDLYQKMNSGRT